MRAAVPLALAASIGTVTICRAADQPSRAEEYRVKAAILYNLAKFVDWPPDALPSPTAPLTLCVLGVDPFGSAIDDAVKGRQVGGRPLVIRRIADVEPGCHVLFVSTSERKRTSLVLDRLGTSPVLTVGDGEGFSALGGMIELVTDGDRIRFSINTAAADHAKLHLSARLLAIAALRSDQGVLP
jgi:YfiR/HmsC-like